MTLLTPTLRKPRYVASDACSPLLSSKAEAVADFITRRGNRRAAMGLERGTFDGRYFVICGLAKRKYPLPLGTAPQFRTDSPRHEVAKR